MKRILLIISLICISLNSFSYDYNEIFKEENYETSFGVGYGYYGLNTSTYGKSVLNINFTVFGAYFDVGIPFYNNHINSTKIDVWHNEEKGMFFHVGYQIPIIKHLKIGPVLGFTQYEKGTTNGYDWHIGNHSVINNFTTHIKQNEFDFGVMIVGSFGKKYRCNLTGMVTKRAFSITIGIGFNWKYNLY